MVECLNCQTKTSNAKFCSRSCSASFSNREYPRRKITKTCSRDNCNKLIRNWRSSLCEEHFLRKQAKEKDFILNQTLKELRLEQKHLHPSSQYAKIRGYARNWFKELTFLPCANTNCKYDKHVEICHIRRIADFPETATVGEINNRNNIIQFCRKCHWEFDNGLLDGTRWKI